MILAWLVATLFFAALSVVLVKDLRSSDGWSGNALLLLGLGSACAALLCLAGLVFSVITRFVATKPDSYADAARQRSLVRQHQRRSGRAEAAIGEAVRENTSGDKLTGSPPSEV